MAYILKNETVKCIVRSIAFAIPALFVMMTATCSLEGDLDDLEPYEEITAQGDSLTEKLAWVKANARSNKTYFINIGADENVGPHELAYFYPKSKPKKKITISVKGIGSERTISLTSSGSLFTVGEGVTLVLNENIAVRGNNNNNIGLVYVNGGFIMNTGSKIAGNTVSSGNVVYVADNGTFTMNGGTISGNTVSRYGGGVYVNKGTFNMNGGTISGNKTSDNASYRGYGGGGVYVNKGTFNMSGGVISDNTSNSNGGGVYINIGTFNMYGGTISGNKIPNSDGTSSYEGGGVCVYEGTFNMHGGVISGNTSNHGGGVCIDQWGTFNMHGGVISGNTSNLGGGVYIGLYNIFSKTGGTIYGNSASDGSNRNTAQRLDGHAVHCLYKKKGTTAGPEVNLYYNKDSSWSGGWDN
jgi:hypothetical protein